MLKRLHIRNYALIDELEINFSDRLTIITGETGAGKSILLGALGLVMGERADNKVFYNEGEKCVVEAEFDIREYDLAEFFSDQELDYEQELVIRRELSPAGKSRAFVNDTPVNNQVLQRLTESLIDLHQQFDTLDIHNVNFQLRMVDALADNAQRLRAYHDIYKVYSAAKRKLANLIQRSEQGAKEMEFLLFQLGELEQAALVAGEDESMEAELERLSNAESIKQTYGAAYNYLQENEQNLVGQLQELGRSMQATRKFSPQLDAIAEQVQQVVAELQDIAKSCERISEQTEYDGQRIAEIQERLNVIYKLQKKHQASSVAELLAIQEQLQEQTGGYSDLGAEITRIEQEIVAHEKTLRVQAAELTERRRGVAPGFEAKVQEMLHQLSMPHARLKVDFQELSELNATGADEVRFLFSTNVGSKFLPIKDVASGGELSRLTLCTKSLVADAIPLPTLIFDEIDTGISGDVSLRMGIILKELSDRHQVISITHTPQIAARADKHYFVYKKVDENRTITNIRLLTPDERVRSLAVMLSGNPPSDSAMATARELMG